MLAEENRTYAVRAISAHRIEQLTSAVTFVGSALVIIFTAVSMILSRRSAQARDAAEALLRDTNLNLEATVDERTADLREANDEIQRLAHIVSHDLRSPLINIMGFTGELEELRTEIFRRISALSRTTAASTGAEPTLEAADLKLWEDFGEALGFIKSSIGKMDRLISAILNLTREGRRRFEPVAIDTRQLIEGIVATLAHQASEVKASIHVAELPNIVCDRLAPEQIFSNLIDNAIKYARPGVLGERANRIGLCGLRGRRQWSRNRSQGSSAHFRPVPARGSPGQTGTGYWPCLCPYSGAPAWWYDSCRIRTQQRQHLRDNTPHRLDGGQPKPGRIMSMTEIDVLRQIKQNKYLESKLKTFANPLHHLGLFFSVI